MKLNPPIIRLQTVDSTNLYAERLLKAGKVTEGTVIVASEQTSGKGQGRSRWESEPGKNATFSLVLLPGFLPPEMQFLLNKAISLGVLDFFRQTLPEQVFSIKWPNDIYAGDRKIGGILIQVTVCGTMIESCIAGIGVNLNQETFSIGLPNPVSLKQLNGKSFPVQDAVNGIADCIAKRYHMLQSGMHEPLNRDYREHLFGFNSWRKYMSDDKPIKGRIQDVDGPGMLIMELEDGTVRLFNHGDVTFILR